MAAGRPSPPGRCPEGSRPTLGEGVFSFWRGGCRFEMAGNAVALASPSPSVGREPSGQRLGMRAISRVATQQESRNHNGPGPLYERCLFPVAYGFRSM